MLILIASSVKGFPQKRSGLYYHRSFLCITALSFPESTGTCRDLGTQGWGKVERLCWRVVIHMVALCLGLLPALTPGLACLVLLTLPDIFCFHNDFLRCIRYPSFGQLRFSTQFLYVDGEKFLSHRNSRLHSNQVKWLCLCLSVLEYSLIVRRLDCSVHRRI